MSVWQILNQHISAITGDAFRDFTIQAVGGGCVNKSYRLRGAERDYFAKLNDAPLLPMFEAEAQALLAIGATSTLAVPQPICWGSSGDHSYLVLEYLPLRSARESDMKALGKQLAVLHQATWSFFGWQRDNTIGSTEQINTASQDWVAFWRQNRLGFQLGLAAQNGYGEALQRRGGLLMECFDSLFANYSPAPSLLHGDLWSGNVAFDDHRGCPVVFDPASYYGDRETDLAMTELFGGFSANFYAAYEDTYPLDDGYRIRKVLYNLYHILNHLNLFGNGYLPQAEHTIEWLLTEMK